MRALVSYDGGRFDCDGQDVVIPLLRYPCARRAVETGEVAVVANLDDPLLLDSNGRDSLEKWGYQAQMIMPLVAGGRVVGLVELSDYVPRDYTSDLGLVRALGQVATHALQNSALLDQVERRSRILNELVDLGALANRSHDVDALLRRTAERLLVAVDAANCDIFQMSEDGLRCAASYDRSGFDDQSLGRVLDPDDCPTLVAAMNAHQVLVIDGVDDPRLSERERRLYSDFGFASEVCIPLVVGGRLYGLIDLYDTRRRDYTEYLGFLRSVGQTLAGALENSVLFEQIEQRTTVLKEIVDLGATVSQTHDLQEVLRTIAANLRDTIHAADCEIFTLRGDQLRCLVRVDQDGFDEDVVGHLLDVDRFPATGMAARTGTPMVISSLEDPRLADSERERYKESGFQSELCIPLIVGERLIGLIDLFDTKPRDYAAFIDYLRSVGQMVAGAIDNALLLERVEETNTMLNMLVESGIEFGATLELEPVLHSVARRLCAITDAPTCDISTIQGDELRCVACTDRGTPSPSDSGITHRMADLPLVRDAVLTHEPLQMADVATDPRLSSREREDDLRRGRRAKLELPLVSRGQVVGIAAVCDDHPRDFEHLDLLRSLAQVAANALANATLFARLDRSAARMALVAEVSFELSSSLDLAEVLRSTADRLCSVADTPMCNIYTLHGQKLVNVVSIHDGEIDRDWQGREFPLAAWTAVRRAVETRRPVSIETINDPSLLPDERALMKAHGETSQLVVPLISKERVIGVLELSDRRGPRAFSSEEIDTVSAVCRLAALAIDNADLVEHLQLRNRENELLNEIAGATSASLNLPDIAAAAIDKLRHIMPFDLGLVALRRDDQTLDIAYATEARADDAPDTLAIPAGRRLLELIRDEKVVALDLPADLPAGLEIPSAEPLSSVTLISLTKGSELIGVLGLGSYARHAFADIDRHLLERTGTHLALAIDNARMYGDIKHMHLGNLKALSSALNAKDYYTLGHAARGAAYMVLLGQELGWPVTLLHQVEEAAYLHDIGKIGVSDRVLLKPSGLNAREWELMRQHPIFSADIIRSLFPEDLVLGVRHHHERFGGGGYPDDLAGEEIPLIARAMCVVDSYDAMSFSRPYRQGLSYPQCVAELRRCRGAQFEPQMVDAFIRVLERLADGRRRARDVARLAASRIDPEEHVLLRAPEDEDRPEYHRILGTFREVCAANPPTRFITSHVRRGKKTVVVVDSGQAGPDKPHIGDEILTDDELLEAFAGRDMDANVLSVDQWGVWISGTAPVLDQDSRVIAAVTADIPATDGVGEFDGLRSSVAQTFASMLDTASVQAGRTEIEAITDGLTGLYNHRYFHERLSEEIERCTDQQGNVSLLFCDLDNFRVFNELHGHATGDQALRAVARVIETSIRHVDIAARFGGEEFAAILIDTDEIGALEVAERIRAGILAANVASDSLSVSIGVASCPSDAIFKEELIDKADWAMYLAKTRGRDQVMSFSAQHGTDTPERAASVTTSYVSAMSELVAARDAYERRRRFAIAHLAQAVGAELDLDKRDVRAMAAAAETDAPHGVTGVARGVLNLAAAYQSMVAERPYRAQLSEAEALDELLGCPALRDDRRLAAAFERVLSGETRSRRPWE
jgi:diguanylate cyclase (GGDEF)-like protein